MEHGLLISLSHLIYHQYMHFKYYWRKFMLGLICHGLCLNIFILGKHTGKHFCRDNSPHVITFLTEKILQLGKKFCTGNLLNKIQQV